MPWFPTQQQESSDEPMSQHLAHMAGGSRRESADARAARLQVKTRRRRYLELNPDYFDAPSLELAGGSHLAQ